MDRLGRPAQNKSIAREQKSVLGINIGTVSNTVDKVDGFKAGLGWIDYLLCKRCCAATL